MESERPDKHDKIVFGSMGRVGVGGGGVGVGGGGGVGGVFSLCHPPQLRQCGIWGGLSYGTVFSMQEHEVSTNLSSHWLLLVCIHLKLIWTVVTSHAVDCTMWTDHLNGKLQNTFKLIQVKGYTSIIQIWQLKVEEIMWFMISLKPHALMWFKTWVTEFGTTESNAIPLGLGDTGRDRWDHCAQGCGYLRQMSSLLPLEDVGWGSLHHRGRKEVPLRDGAVNEGVLQLSRPPWLGFEFEAVLLPCSGITVFEHEPLFGDSNFSIHDLVHERQLLVLPPLLECWSF